MRLHSATALFNHGTELVTCERYTIAIEQKEWGLSTGSFADSMQVLMSDDCLVLFATLFHSDEPFSSKAMYG